MLRKAYVSVMLSFSIIRSIKKYSIWYYNRMTSLIKSRKNINFTLHITMFFLFLLISIAIFFVLENRMQHNKECHLQIITDRYEAAYNIIYGHYKKLAGNVYEGILERYDVQAIYQQLLTANFQKKTRLRSVLYTKIHKQYERLKENGDVRQLHFHLRNNESFLRFQRPDKYGDNLTSIRETVNYVNTVHRPIDGFEEGKVYYGYRFVFPITSVDGVHLGSMEVSYGPEFITALLMKQYGVLSNFYVRNTAIQKKLFADEIQETYLESYHDDYLCDRHVLAILKKAANESEMYLKPNSKTMETVFTNAHSGNSVSFYAPSIDTVFTTIPVFTSINPKMVAFLTVRSKSVFFKNENKYNRIIFVLSFSLLLLGFLIYYVLVGQKKIIEGKAKQLEKEKQRLMAVQHIGSLGHWELDFVSNELSWSDQIFRIFDIPPQSCTASFDLFLKQVHPDDREFVKNSHVDALKNHYPYTIQYRLVTSTNTEKWVSETWYTEHDNSGYPLCLLGIMHDITEQQNTLASLQQKHNMFMHGPVMIFIWQNRENWPVEYLSGNVSETLGYSVNEFLDGFVKYIDIIHPDDQERVVREVTKYSHSDVDKFVHEPYRLIDSKGESVWVLDSTSMIRDSQGVLNHFQGYLVDITKTMNMQDEIMEVNKRLELVIDGANLGTWDSNLETGEIVHNKRWAEMIGYSIAEIEADKFLWKNIIHPDDFQDVQRQITDYFEGRTPIYKTEHRLQHKSGKWIWVLDIGKVLERDKEGRPLRAAGINLDITESKEAARNFLESKEQQYMQRYVKAIDDIGLGLFVVDEDYRIRDMNITMIDWFGDQRGKICFESVAGLDKPCSYCYLKEVITEGCTIKYKPVTPEGRIYDIVAVPLENLEGTVSMMEIIRDITEQEHSKTALIATNRQLEEAIASTEKMAEIAEEANHAKSVFLSTMGHELRTPLNAILGYTQIFSEDSSLSPKVQMGVQTIQKSGEHLLLLLNDILDLSKIDAGKMELVQTEFRLPEFLQGILGIIKLRAQEKGIDCYYAAETAIPAIIETDELRLRQVILNLLSNAVKFTDEGHCTLYISSYPFGTNKALLTCMVEDSGIGIAPNMQEEIFEVFQQTGQRLKYSEGYGLGLSISRKLVQLMGGNLTVVSPIYKQQEDSSEPGSRFSFTIEVGASGELLEMHDEQAHLEDSEMPAPPYEILETIIQLAKSGDIDGISEESDEIALLENGKYKAFSSHIKRLAGKFKLIEIVKFVTRYIKD